MVVAAVVVVVVVVEEVLVVVAVVVEEVLVVVVAVVVVVVVVVVIERTGSSLHLGVLAVKPHRSGQRVDRGRHLVIRSSRFAHLSYLRLASYMYTFQLISLSLPPSLPHSVDTSSCMYT